jgi:hypothetical protein
MDIYVVESFADVLPHGTGQSRGVEAEGFTGQGRLYVHLLPLEDKEAKSLSQTDRALKRHGPANGSWWVVEGNAFAHWPGLPSVRARFVRGRPVPLREQLTNGSKSSRATKTTATTATTSPKTKAASSTPARVARTTKASDSRHGTTKRAPAKSAKS